MCRAFQVPAPKASNLVCMNVSYSLQVMFVMLGFGRMQTSAHLSEYALPCAIIVWKKATTSSVGDLSLRKVHIPSINECVQESDIIDHEQSPNRLAWSGNSKVADSSPDSVSRPNRKVHREF